MAMTAAQRRKADRDRKRAMRALLAVEGKPIRVETINAAIAEANSFVIDTADQRVWIPSLGWHPVNSAVIIEVATDILATRLGIERGPAKKAVVDRLRRRKAHSMPTFVPSKCPDPGLPRYNTAAPAKALSGI